MSAAQLEELKGKIQKGEMDRPSLIKALRKIRMRAVNEADQTVLGMFKEPVEVVADRWITDLRK